MKPSPSQPPAPIAGIPGDGDDEDSPFLPQGVPVLHVHVFPHWFGWVRSSPYLIDCPRACQRPVEAGTAITLVATPNSGWTFDHWSGGPCDGQTTATCLLRTPNAALTDVIANFKEGS